MSDFLHKGGLWMLTQNILTLAVLVLGPMFHGQPWHWSFIAFGAALFVVGAVFGIVGVLALGRSLTPYPKPREDGKLVQSSIYNVVRHPLYSSLIMLTLGWSLLWSSWLALAVAFDLAVLLDAKARLEERWLRERYPDYDAYSLRVRRFVPWVY